MDSLVGKKIGMSQVFDGESGDLIPVTVLEVEPCTVVALRTVEKHGYQAPFPSVLDWMWIRCPFCRKRPFIAEDKIMTTSGLYDIVRKELIG